MAEVASPLAVEHRALHAREADLRYVAVDEPGIQRARRGGGFSYVHPHGARIDHDDLLRIKALAIPPAWTNVWICVDERGHIQATGRDARGRKQYRYHPRWREVRDAAKYDRTLAFGEALPSLRTQVERDLARPGLPREKVLAVVVRLLEETLARVGNAEYARANGHFGLTTLRDRHAEFHRGKVLFRYKGKVGRMHEAAVDDPRVARVVKACQDLPGQELFQFLDDDGEPRPVGSADVNEYLRQVAGAAFSAKDFRTWAGSALAARELASMPEEASQRGRKRQVTLALERVSERLSNTVAVCRKCYVHPAVLDAHLDGSLGARYRPDPKDPASLRRRLGEDERALLALLRTA